MKKTHNFGATQHLGILLIILTTLFGSCFLNETGGDEFSQTGSNAISIGMEQEDFVAMYPDAVQTGPEQFVRESVEYGLKGEWLYSFHDDGLSWYVFTAHESEINELNFQRTFSATQEIISSLSNQYGEPWRIDNGYSEFIDPSDRQHEGYKVREARWRTGDGELLVDFSFLGDGGVYSLLVTLQATS